jgi:large subunit ribosomal protein L30
MAKKKIKLTQIKSGIGSTKRQKLTLVALGIRKLNNTIEVESSPQIQGMITKVRHLLRVEEK